MRILLPIDNSKFSEAAIRAVTERGRPQHTEVRILHVVESMPLLVSREMAGYDPALDTAWESQKQNAEALVATAAESLHARGLKVTTTIVEGDPKSRILDLAEEWHADLIVIGSHGRNALNRFLMGSVSDAVARHARCSVEIVRIPPVTLND
jgi:nucleotide-binding universal stress UspA family protein